MEFILNIMIYIVKVDAQTLGPLIVSRTNYFFISCCP